MSNDTHGLELLAGVPVILIVVGWIAVAIAAAIVAPAGRNGPFFIITLLFLGPLGLAAAAVAQPRT